MGTELRVLALAGCCLGVACFLPASHLGSLSGGKVPSTGLRPTLFLLAGCELSALLSKYSQLPHSSVSGRWIFAQIKEGEFFLSHERNNPSLSHLPNTISSLGTKQKKSQGAQPYPSGITGVEYSILQLVGQCSVLHQYICFLLWNNAKDYEL